MKTIKKALSLFVAVMMMTAMGSIGVFAAQLMGTTFEYDATNKTSSIGASTNFAADTQFLVIEYTYTPEVTNKTVGAGPYNGTNYWMPIRFGSDGTIKANYYSNSTSSATNIGNYVAGETYHVLGIIKLGSNVSGAARIYLNGVSLGSYSIWTNTTAWYQKLYISPGIKAQITTVSGIETAADFDASAYSALVTSTNSDVTITGEGYNTALFRNFAINITRKLETSVNDLISSYLTVPTGATAKVYTADGAERQGTNILENGDVLKVTSANGAVSHEYAITVADHWPNIPISVDNTSGTSSAGAGITVSDGDFLKIEYTYTPKAKAGTWAGLYQSSKDKIWGPIRFTSDGKIQADHYYGAGENLKDIGEYVIGDTYSIVSVVQIKDSGNAKACIYLNGQQLFAEKTIYTTMATFGFNRLYAGAGTKATITKLTNINSVTDFDASAYNAQLTSNDSGIIITADKYDGKAFQNFEITTAKNVKASELLAALTIPQNAIAKVYNTAGTEAGNDDTVLDGYSVKVTSANGFTTLTYDVTKVAADKISYTTDADGNLTATVIENVAGNGKLYLAAYDTVNGKLVLSKVIAGKAADAQLPTLEAVFSESQFAGKTVKAFYWNANLIPIDFKEYTE